MISGLVTQVRVLLATLEAKLTQLVQETGSNRAEANNLTKKLDSLGEKAVVPEFSGEGLRQWCQTVKQKVHHYAPVLEKAMRMAESLSTEAVTAQHLRDWRVTEDMEEALVQVMYRVCSGMAGTFIRNARERAPDVGGLSCTGCWSRSTTPRIPR